MAFFCLLVLINGSLLFFVPKDNNNYLCEYNDKIELLKKVEQPRIVFIGGSSIPFGTNSQTIKDSLKMNVVDFGLHSGIGIRIPIEDYLSNAKRGDIAVLQIEYAEFFTGGVGEQETLLPFLISTDWSTLNLLNSSQMMIVVRGIPHVAYGNMRRLLSYLSTKSFDKEVSSVTFSYTRSGFNEYGDEVSHLNYPNQPELQKSEGKERIVNEDFIIWLDKMLKRYEDAGVVVLMVPPVCTKSLFEVAYSESIEKALKRINRPYVVNPTYMVLDDSCKFNTGYHVDKNGVKQNTEHLISILNKTLK